CRDDLSAGTGLARGASVAAATAAHREGAGSAACVLDRPRRDGRHAGRDGGADRLLHPAVRDDLGEPALAVVRLPVAIARQRLLLLPLLARFDPGAASRACAEHANRRPGLAGWRLAHLPAGGGVS